MKLLISTSIFSLVAISAVAGVMPDEIPSTANAIAETVEAASGAETTVTQPQPTFKEQLDGLIQFAFTAIFILL
tara:strand:+ start:59 stop:280 length:222 start_codon:yes stop_codon:yes gene_type:complete